MIYIIDGYNVMYTRVKEPLGPKELEARREALIEEIINYIATAGDEGYIVFDSRKAEATECHSIPGTAVTVCYSSRLESADLFIGKLVQKKLSESTGNIRVVSADWEVQRGAMMERVERIPPRNLLSSMKNLAEKLAFSPENDKIRWKLEHKVDIETLRKLEEMRRGKD